MNGYDFKEFQNNDRLVLGNIEYRIYGREGIFDWNEINLILFADAGYVWNTDDNSSAVNGFDHIDWEDLKTDVGLALSNYDGNVRVNIAKRLDENKDDVVLTFRISRPF